MTDVMTTTRMLQQLLLLLLLMRLHYLEATRKIPSSTAAISVNLSTLSVGQRNNSPTILGCGCFGKV